MLPKDDKSSSRRQSVCLAAVVHSFSPSSIEGGSQERRYINTVASEETQEEAEVAEAKEKLRLLQLQTLKYSTLWLIFQVPLPYTRSISR